MNEKKNRSNITFIDDLKEWCFNRASYPPPDKMHQINQFQLFGNFLFYFSFFQPFIPYFNAIDINTIFICIATRQLLSICKWSLTLADDCTYKITSCELPFLIFGTSDIYRRFFPMDLCLVSTDEVSETFATLLKGMQA